MGGTCWVRGMSGAAARTGSFKKRRKKRIIYKRRTGDC